MTGGTPRFAYDLLRAPLHRPAHLTQIPVQIQPAVLRDDALDLRMLRRSSHDRRSVHEPVVFRRLHVPDGLVGVEKSRIPELTPEILAGIEQSVADTAFVPALAAVEHAVHIDADYPSESRADRTHPAGAVERKVGCRSAVRLSDPREQKAQQSVQLAAGPDGGTSVAPESALIDDDCRRQVPDQVDIRLQMLRKPAPQESGIGLVHLPLGFCRDGIEDDARLAGT